MGCLGDSDHDTGVFNHPRKKVIVGAPYFDGNGAVFVYRYSQNKLELSQTIKSPGKDLEINKCINKKIELI